MKCEEVQEQLSEYLDTAQGGAVARGIEAHLAGCMGCAEALADLAECRRLIAALPQVEPPIGFTTRVMAHVRETAARPNWRQRLFFPLPIKLPIQATAILAIGVLAVYLLQKEQSYKQLLPKQEPSLMDGSDGQAKRESRNSPAAAQPTKSAALGRAQITQGQPQTAPKPEAPASLRQGPPSSEQEVTDARRQEFAAKKDSLSSLSPTRPEPSRANAPASEKTTSVPPPATSSELPAKPSKPIASAIGVSQRAGAPLMPMASPPLDILFPDRESRAPLAERTFGLPAQPVADYEIVVRRHPLPPRQEPVPSEGSSALGSRGENDNAKMADGNPAAARFYGAAAPSVVITSWHKIAANRYEQFKKELATQGNIESETPLSGQEKESLFKSAEPLTIKVTILPPQSSDTAR